MLKKSIRLGVLRAIPKLGSLLGGRSYRQSEGPPRKILLIRPDHLGDLLFTSPTLKILKAFYPEAEITMLVGPWSMEAAQRLPAVDNLISCPFAWFDRGRNGPPLRPYKLLIEESNRLRNLQFDLAINMRFDFWWGALLAYAAGIPTRIGYDVPECSPFLTQAVPYKAGRHEVLQNLSLVEAVSGSSSVDPQLEFLVTEQDEALADTWLTSINARQPVVAVHPGAGASVKLWPPVNYVRLVDSLVRDNGATVILTGSGGERPLLEEISGKSAHQPRLLAGPSLGQLAAVLKHCSLVIGSDSGVLHLAVAVSAPTVHLYGPVSVDIFGPWGDRRSHRVITAPYPCAPCNVLDYPAEALAAHRCMAAISTETVLREVEVILKENKFAHRD
ncbi:MAG: glycosyltransferase family 9 protein [Dehalococcoidia bacterium]|nr:glycosyltransferase family 9 protein [Dehalococcoidia bacterium]